MEFKISKEFIQEIESLISEKNEQAILQLLDDIHFADIAELMNELKGTDAGYLFKILDSEISSEILLELDEEVREKILNNLSAKEIAEELDEIYIPKVDSVKVDTEDTEVARIMQKYDLEAIPVIDENNRLVGRITIDDIVDVIKEEADRDYQMAAGISQDVEADDSIWDLTRARLPWLLLALIGSFIAVNISQSFGDAMDKYATLFFFTPLVAAMAGNVGVQSSAIIVQGLANNSLSGSIWKRLGKEMLLALLNSTILAGALLLATHFIMGTNYEISSTIVLALITVMILASLIGTFIPIMLHKYGIDPAIATGPFITTSNDIFGLLIYFTIAKMILGF